MNLYMCWEKESEYVVFVFAVNANQARRMTRDWEYEIGNYDVTYHDIEYSLVGKTDKVIESVVIDTDFHPMYSIVKEMGEMGNAVTVNVIEWIGKRIKEKNKP